MSYLYDENPYEVTQPLYLYNRNPHPGKTISILRWGLVLSCSGQGGFSVLREDGTLSPAPFCGGITASWQQLPQAQVNYLDQPVNRAVRPVDFDVVCWWSVHRSLDQGGKCLLIHLAVTSLVSMHFCANCYLRLTSNISHNRIKSLSAEQNGRHFVQMTFADAFSRKKIFIIWYTFHRSLYPKFQLATSQYWFR